MERCSVCKRQWISCAHMNHEPEKSKWTGEWPGVVECRKLGFYCVERPHTNHPKGGWFWPCTPNYPGSREDLNRLARYHAHGDDRAYEGTSVLGIESCFESNDED